MLESIESTGWFADRADALLSGLRRAKVPDGTTPGTKTRWAAGNFDDTGEIRALLGALYPGCTTPIRLMEHLVNEGIHMVAKRMKSDAIGPADFHRPGGFDELIFRQHHLGLCEEDVLTEFRLWINTHGILL